MPGFSLLEDGGTAGLNNVVNSVNKGGGGTAGTAAKVDSSVAGVADTQTIAKAGTGDAGSLSTVAKSGNKDAINAVMKDGQWNGLLKAAGYSTLVAALIVGLGFLLPKALKSAAQELGSLLFPCLSSQYQGPACCWTSSCSSCCVLSSLVLLIYTQSSEE